MPFLAACAFCGRESHVPDGARGSSTWCPNCSKVFTLAPKDPLPAPGRAPQRAPLPFLAVCSHCQRQSLVPASARGTSVWCPQCSNFFTVARKRRTDVQVFAEALPDNSSDSWWAGPPALVVEPPVAVIAVPEPVSEAIPLAPEPIPLVERALPALPALPPTPAARDQQPSEPPRDIDPLGITALFLACIALLCASAPWLCLMVLPLSLLAVLAGAVALVRAVRSGRSRLLFPGVGTAVAGAVVTLAVMFPGVLGPKYLTYKDQTPVDPTTIRRIPLPGKTASTQDDDPEWADASSVALQQGKLTIQVDEVAITEFATAVAPNKKGKMVCLLIRLRIRDTSGQAGKAPSDLGTLKQEQRPVLTEGTAKVYELLDIQTGTAAKGRAGSELGMVSRVLLFDAPGAEVQTLRLEIPAEAWGGVGTFRFAIPSSLIRRKP
jgi:hypothetical protein